MDRLAENAGEAVAGGVRACPAAPGGQKEITLDSTVRYCQGLSLFRFNHWLTSLSADSDSAPSFPFRPYFLILLRAFRPKCRAIKLSKAVSPGFSPVRPQCGFLVARNQRRRIPVAVTLSTSILRRACPWFEAAGIYLYIGITLSDYNLAQDFLNFNLENCIKYPISLRAKRRIRLDLPARG